jgi:hypothetical protein
MAGGAVGAVGGAVVPAAAQTRAATDESVQRLADIAASGAWNRFSSRMMVRRQWVGTNGLPTGPSPVVDEYLYEREKTTQGWRTRVSVVGATPVTVRTPGGEATLPADRGIARMEDAEDGTPPRFFTRAGTEVLPPAAGARMRFMSPGGLAAGGFSAVGAGGRGGPGGPGDLSLAGPDGLDPAVVSQATAVNGLRPGVGREWVNAIVLPGGERTARLARLTRPFGRRQGWVRGYGQYVRQAGLRSLELLVDEQDGVPVEANVADNGRLQSHAMFAYERAATGALIRRGVRLEQRAGDVRVAADARAVTEITYAQVQLTNGGR